MDGKDGISYNKWNKGNDIRRNNRNSNSSSRESREGNCTYRQTESKQTANQEDISDFGRTSNKSGELELFSSSLI